jgi:hypothetical protein
MPNSESYKINATVYATVSILVVVAVLGFKFYNPATHDASRAVRQVSVIQDAGITIEDLNGTLSASQEDDLKDMLRLQMLFHEQHTPWTAPLSVKVSLWESNTDFKDYQRRISKNSTSPKGFYSRSRQELVVNKSQSAYLKTLAHEAQHMLVRRDGFRPPKWLNEGLSEYFEEMTQDSSGDVFVAAQPWRSKRLRQWLEAGELPPLSQFLNRSSAEWKVQDEKVPYLSQTLSWGLVYFLMETPQGRNTLLETIKDLKQGQHDGDSARALNAHYALSQLEQDFYRFIPEIPAQQKYLQE